MWLSFLSIFVSRRHRYILSRAWHRANYGGFFIFQKLWFFQEKGFKYRNTSSDEIHFLFFHCIGITSSLPPLYQEKEYLRLPGYLVLSRSDSLFLSVSQQSSRDHCKHGEAKAGLYTIPMVLSDRCVGKKHQRQILSISTFRTNVNLHCNSSILRWNN